MSFFDRLTAATAALIVIDVQEKLVTRIDQRDRVIANALLLARGANLLGIPVWATEQYPKGLGPTIAPLVELIPRRPDKTMFHCASIPSILEDLYYHKIRHVTLAGIEAHVCVAQSALELLKLGFKVQISADAVGSRHAIDREFALRRLERVGAVVSTTEAILFEWMESADHPRFKEFSAMIKEADLSKSSAP